MKFSTVSLTFATLVAMPGLATGDLFAEQHEAADGALQASPTRINCHLNVGFRRIKQRPQEQDVAFLGQAIKRAYNSIHGPLNDDYQFLDFNCTAIQMQDDTTADTLTDMLYDNLESLSPWAGGSRKKVRRYRVNSYGIGDIGCDLCSNDDDGLGLEFGGATATTAADSGLIGRPPPFASIKPVEDMLCKILQKEGNKDVFGDVSDCTIFPFDSLGSWDLEEPRDSTAVQDQSKPAVPVSTFAIDLQGLSCNEAQDFVDCRDDLMQKIVSDALVIAYNKVNFANDYLLEDFVPVSFELVRGEDTMSALRGATATTPIPLAPIGVFRGTSHIQCRACAANQAESDDPVMEPFHKLRAVESNFCEMIAIVADKVGALASLQGCSLSVVSVIEEANVPGTLVLKTD